MIKLIAVIEHQKRIHQLVPGDSRRLRRVHRLLQMLLCDAEVLLAEKIRVHAGDKAPLARDRLDKTAPLQLLICPLGGDNADPQLLRQKAHRGQRLTRLKRAGDNEILDLRRDLLIDGSWVSIGNNDFQMSHRLLSLCISELFIYTVYIYYTQYNAKVNSYL